MRFRRRLKDVLFVAMGTRNSTIVLAKKVVLPSSGVLRAIGVSERRIFVATDRYITGFDAQNQIVERYIAEPGIRAISLLEGSGSAPRQLVFGFSDGGVELRTTKKNGLEATLRLQQTPSSPASKIEQGPAGTIAIGFTDGVFGVWSRDTGQRIISTRLHGAITDIDFTEKDLIALSELGDVLKWDVKVLSAHQCDVLKGMWKDVAVVWKDGEPRVEPPISSHRCMRSAAH